MKKYLLALFCSFISIAVFSQFTIKQKLGTTAEVSLPAKPELRTLNEGMIYVSHYNGVNYLAQVTGVKKGIKDYFTSHLADSIYDGFIKGNLKATNGKIVYKDHIKIAGVDALEFGYKGNKNGTTIFSYQRVVCYNDTLISVSVWAADSVSKKHPILNAYFNTLKITSKNNVGQSNSKDLAYKFGEFIGYGLVIVILICIPFLFIYIVRKIALRKS